MLFFSAQLWVLSGYCLLSLDDNEVEIINPEDQRYFDIRNIRTLNDEIYFDVKLIKGRGLYKLQDNGHVRDIYLDKFAFGIFLIDRDNLGVSRSSEDYSEKKLPWSILNIDT